jgi:hypothetical protein
MHIFPDNGAGRRHRRYKRQNLDLIPIPRKRGLSFGPLPAWGGASERSIVREAETRRSVPAYSIVSAPKILIAGHPYMSHQIHALWDIAGSGMLIARSDIRDLNKSSQEYLRFNMGRIRKWRLKKKRRKSKNNPNPKSS